MRTWTRLLPAALVALPFSILPVVAATPPPLSNPTATPEAPLGPVFPGGVAGSGVVSAAGNAAYNVPIFITPGSNGMQPELALSYNSNMQNGMVGLGWFMQGANSKINRCPQTYSQDGAPHAVDYTADDRFCLDGHRLLLVGGGTYGDSGTEYRTEIDSFQRITAVGSVGTGPNHFKVESPDGRVRYYGSTNDARIKAQGSNEVRVWALNRVEDPSTNYYTIEYFEDNNAGSYYPEFIHYTGNDNNGSSPYAKVEFVYEDRDDKPIRFMGGSKITDHPKRLKKIRSLINATDDLVTEYRLDYEMFGTNAGPNPPYGNQSRLKTIRRCDAMGDCQEDLEIDWVADNNGVTINSYLLDVPGDTTEPKQNALSPRWIDLNGDGTPDYVHTEQTVYATLPAMTGNYEVMLSDHSEPDGWREESWTVLPDIPHPNTDFDRREWADLDGDGRTDMIKPKYQWLSPSSRRYDFYVAFSTPSGFDVQTWTGYIEGQNDKKHYYRDMNGDKRLDLVVVVETSTVSTNHYDCGGNLQVYQDSRYRIDVQLNNGTDFSAGTTWASNLRRSVHIQDMNGDGLADIVENTYLVHMNNGSGFDAFQNFGDPGVLECTDPTRYQADFADWNNDGLADRLRVIGPFFIIDYNTGKSFLQAGATAMIPYSDINGDGSLDYYSREITPSGASNAGLADIKLHFMTDDDIGLETDLEHLSNDSDLVRFNQLADVDGDGMAEYTAIRTQDCQGTETCERLKLRVYNNDDPRHNLIAKITTGTGVETKFTYDPLTNQDIYTKHTDGSLPIEDIQDATHVVTKFEVSDGVGGYTTLRYKYEGLKRDQGGRGLLGFAKITVDNWDADTTTITEYEQVFPYTSQPKNHELRRSSDNRLLSQTETSYTVVGTVGSGPVFPYVDSQIQRSYDLASGALLATTTSTSDVVDAYGNVEESTVFVEDHIHATNHQKRSVSVFDTTDITNWRVKQLESTVEKHWKNGVHAANKDKHVNFEYYPSTGYVEKTIREQGMGSLLELTVALEYDVFGNINKETTSGPGIASRFSTTEWTARGRFPYIEKNALLHQDIYTWNGKLGVMSTHTDANGLLTTWEHDTFGRQEKEIRPDLTETETLHYYDNSGAVPNSVFYVETLTTGAPPKRVFLDRLGRTVSERSQTFDGSYTNVRTDYDNLGRVQQTSEPYFDGDTVHWNVLTHDLLGRQTSLDAADSTKDFLRYYNDFDTTTFQPGGRSAKSVHNALGQLVWNEDYAGTKTLFVYDAAGNREEVRNDWQGAKENSVFYTYDRLGQMLTQNDPDHGLYTYVYNALGQKVDEISPKLALSLEKISYSYDLIGRMKTRTEPEGTTTWVYDDTTSGNLGIGKLHSEVKSGYSRTYSYAPGNFGRATGSQTIIDGIPYDSAVSYNSIGQIDTQTYPSGFVVAYDHNALGYLERVRTSNGLKTFYQMQDSDAAGRVTQEWLGDGSTTVNQYDGQSSRIADQHATNTFGDVQHFSYTYESFGSMWTRTDHVNVQTETFSYDIMDRLDDAQVGANPIIDYNFDQIGNLTTKSDLGDPLNYTSPAVHALTEVDTGGGIDTLNYDDNGNLAFGSNAPTIGWTSYNKPSSISRNGISYDFYYGTDRKRYKKVKGTQLTHYIGNNYEKIIDGNVWAERHYIRANGKVIAMRNTYLGWPADHYLHHDHLGSITARTDDITGAVIERFSYDAWGKRRDATDWSLPAPVTLEIRGYTGHEQLDDIGVIHMNGRVYSPELGRMLSPDPVTQAPDDGQNYNRYSYANNNPLKYSDPEGFAFVNVIEECGRAAVQEGSNWIQNARCGVELFDFLGGLFGTSRPCIGACVARGEATRAQAEAFPHWCRADEGCIANFQDATARLSLWRGGLAGLGQSTSSGDNVTADGDRVRRIEVVWNVKQVSPGFFSTPFGSQNIGNHFYQYTASICQRSSTCNDAYADKVFAYVNQRDVPLSIDDVGSGRKTLSGAFQIDHTEFVADRVSVNRTIPYRHIFQGQVVHQVHWGGGELQYTVTGWGYGYAPYFNNFMGSIFFGGLAEQVAEEFGF